MAIGGFERALPRILVYEGGAVDDPKDPGGRTCKGITQRVYSAFLKGRNIPARDVWKITDAEVYQIYKESYWDKVGGDFLPEGVDYAVFDAAINSGVGQSTRWLQASLKGYKGQRDGVIGDQTLNAVQAVGDCDMLIADLCARRLAMVKGLKTWSRYGKGWEARITNVQKIGQSWAIGSVGPDPIAVQPHGGAAKANIADLKKPGISQTAMTAATAVTSGSAIATDVIQKLLPLGDQFEWMKYALGLASVIALTGGIVARNLKTTLQEIEASQARTLIDTEADASFEAIPVEDLPTPDPVVIAQPVGSAS